MEDSLRQEEQSPNNKIKGCILPWIHMYGSLQGTFYNCCHVEFNASNPIILGDHNQKLSDIWNGEKLKQVRKDFLKGRPPKECVEVCYRVEGKGGNSNRLQVNKRFSDKAKVQNLTKPDGSLESYPSYIDIRFGNLCNFKCRMCGPGASSSWYKDAINPRSGGIIDYFSNNVQLWEELPTFLPYIEDVYFAGGEPFVQDGHYKLLDLMIESGYSSKISLQYNTNLSYSNYKKHDLKELWSSFKSVSVWPSIEGWQERAEYSRKGLVWADFVKNADHFDNYITTFSSVISIFSIYTMPELIMWVKKQGKSYYGSLLQAPPYYDITCLPKESKSMINKKYKNFITKAESVLSNDDITQMLSWLKYMNSMDNTDRLEKFKEEQERLDQLRDESFVDTFPEFAEWYKTI